MPHSAGRPSDTTPRRIRNAWAAAGPSTLTSRPATPRRLARALGGTLPARGQRIGLLGGSFNPAHGGHLRISETALQRLRLDAVWWLVSPQNPLKPKTGMAPLAERLASARAVTNGRARVRATAIEAELGTLRTLDTLRALTCRFPEVRFVWLMGADNLVQIDRWANWPQIFRSVPVAVFDRPNYSLRANAAKAAQHFRQARLPESKSGRLAESKPPAWVFLHATRDPRSATEIRAQRR
ncbi:nicotinate-nucleotide adenylyltransferase [Rhodovibrio salinarum]|uniref:Probable nicotinate-nucleotide adenylyltransferase n=1 Tax=Rhodovibrio salinarum TaxID=1087 RepID=A0A934QF67_9PROT|nr:nicotinate-nucleotide adenylyltransferase [Rhodovibrio salinarum]MBK1695978.1 nicotinate-nucleotide adenylyltransferase [Rhodovibrio salinarum]